MTKSAPSEKLILTSLERAAASLEDILRQPYSQYIRDGVIQRFEYTFELCWKFLQRELKQLGVIVGNPKDVFREAQKSALIIDVQVWFEFLKARNLTSHTYNENTAKEVYDVAVRFPPFVAAVLTELRKRNAQ